MSAMLRRWWALAGLVLVWGSGAVSGAGPREFAELEGKLERLRARWKIPGLAAGIARGGEIVWTKEFGFADLEARRPVTEETVFHLASLTKPFAAVVLMQLVQEGRLDLETPVAQFGIELGGQGTIRVRHLLTHTSEGKPGEVFRYNGQRFAELDKVLRGATGESFAKLVAERVLGPLNLTNTTPNPYSPAACREAGRDPEAFLARSAQGYDFEGKNRVEYRKHFVTAAGLVSNAQDVLKFSMALDGEGLLRAETRARMFATARNAKGEKLAYGLGWFLQTRRGATIWWHYGWDRANASLIIKVPEKDVSFVLLANSEALSRKFDLGQDEDVRRSPFARAFLETLGL